MDKTGCFIVVVLVLGIVQMLIIEYDKDDLLEILKGEDNEND